MKKVFLSPLVLRRGNPVMTFVSRERSSSNPKEWNYWLGTYHDFEGRGVPAEVTDYKSVSKTAISRELYLAFLKESRRQHRRFKVNPMAYRMTMGSRG